MGSWPCCALQRHFDTSDCIASAIIKARNGFPPLARATPAAIGEVHREPSRLRRS